MNINYFPNLNVAVDMLKILFIFDLSKAKNLLLMLVKFKMKKIIV